MVTRPVHWFDRPWARRGIVSALASMMIGSLAVLVILWSGDWRTRGESAERFAHVANDGGDLPKLWRAPSFTLVDQRHREVTLTSLRGEPFIADFIFTQCTSACPMLTSRMVLLERALTGYDVRFVSFSVDPAHDTPEVLAAYAARWNERETRWTLLSTTDAALADVVGGFRVETEKTHDEKNPILHSSLFFLVDGAGFVRAVYPSERSDAMARIATDVRRLAHGTVATDASAPDLAKDLYTSLGCAGCHENAKLAPPLVNLRGAERMMQDGSKVTIDDAYLRRSILAPGAQVVAGYEPLMPSYGHPLSAEEVDALVAELDLRRSAVDASAPPASVALVVDPVCHMKVRAVPEAPHLTFGGKEVYFCSDTCRDAFARDPKRYPFEPVAGEAKTDDAR